MLSSKAGSRHTGVGGVGGGGNGRTPTNLGFPRGLVWEADLSLEHQLQGLVVCLRPCWPSYMARGSEL